MLRSLVFSIVLLFSVLSGLSVAAEGIPFLSDEERTWIKANPVITVGNELDWPPFDYVENGKPAGYSIDKVSLIAEKAGLQIEFVNGFTWEELMQKFRQGEIDVMPAVYTSEKRQEFMLFTNEYFSHPSVIVVHSDNYDIVGLEDIAGKRVAGVSNFVITETLTEVAPEAEIIQVTNVIEGLKSVSLRQVDAFIDSIGVVTYYIENNYIPNLKIIGKVEHERLENPQLHMGVLKGNDILLSILNKGLLAETREERSRLDNRWITQPSVTITPPKTKKLTLTPEQRSWLDKHPVISVGIDEAYAPYSFVGANNRYVGVAPDFLELISEMLGVRFEPVPDLSWPEIVQGVKDHSLDLIATAVITPERTKFLNFTEIYIPTPLVVMSRIDDNRVSKRSDIDGMQVALVQGYSSSKQVLKDFPAITPVMVSTPLAGLRAVATGKADAYVGVLGINIHQAQVNGITNLKVAASYDILKNGQRFAVRSDWPELAQILQTALNAINEKQRQSIYDKWIRIRQAEVVDYSLFWKSLAIFLLVVGLLYLYIRKLNSEISRRKRAEGELSKANMALEAANIEANKANLAKSEFLSRMSHELRTPLTAILGFSQLLELEIKDEKNHSRLREVVSAGEHLLELINEILDLARIESGRIDLHFDDVAVKPAIVECIHLIEANAAQRNIHIYDGTVSGPDFIVRVDHTRFKQVLINFLSNAVKYNSVNGQVRVDAALTRPGYLRISVSDDGPGLSEEQQEKLFVAFERLGAENSNVTGTGIGLVITRQIVENMGGVVGVSSKKGTGSTFWLEVPLVRQ